MNLRWIVLKILDAIEFEGIFVHEAIDKFTDDDQLTKQDRGFIKRVVFGVIEHRIYIDYILNQYSKVKVKKMKPAIRHIMRLSVYQLMFMENIPESAVCNEAVKLVKKRKMFKLGGFVNGVLRAIVRSKESIKLPDPKSNLAEYLSVKYSYEKNLVDFLLKEMSAETLEAFLGVSNEEAPMTIRVNASKCSKNELVAKLKLEGVEVTPGEWLDEALHISGFDRLTKLCSFNDGLFQVQDESSMLVSTVGLEPGMAKVIDVCSAPGGKTLHAADKLGMDGKVFAYDVSAYKLELIRENVERLGYKSIEVNLGDGTIYNESLKEEGDLVIADVPCSGLGIIRKKPDIKWHITPERIESLTQLQRTIVQNVKSYVKPGGVLIYSTCTVTHSENEANVQWFLDNNKNFELQKIDGPYADEATGMIKLLPKSEGPDGFFIAKMRRIL